MEKVLSGVNNIYFIGIGGIGMSGLAFLLKDKGFNISGSDTQESPQTAALRKEGIEVFIGHKKENIPENTNLVAYSSAIKDDNVEMLEARVKGITALKRGELLGLLIWDKKTIAVAGSHGKTTTSAMAGYLLSSLGYGPAVFVGGVPLNYSRNAWWGDDYFVIETDESDGSFLYYNPWVSIITNIDYEHLNYHKTIENLRESFLKFAYQTKGKVLGCGDDPVVRDIVSKTGGWTYGWSHENKFSGTDFSFDGRFSCFSFHIDGKFAFRVKVPLLGSHNALNAMGVLSFLHYIGGDTDKAVKCLEEFKGTKRRFQIKDRVSGITFVDDYGHHPTEIAAVLKAARSLSPKRVVAVFQPHRFSRVKSLYREFGACFSDADMVIITDIYAASEGRIEGVSEQMLLEEIKNNFKKPVLYIPEKCLVRDVQGYLEEGDVVIGLGAGNINILMDGIVNEFKKNRA